MSRVLLTGGAGFVGRHVAAALRAQGDAVGALVRPGAATPDGAERIEVDDVFALGRGWWREACAGADALVHCAWIAEPGAYLDHPANYDCLSGTLEMARGAAGAGLGRVVGIGTCLEYDLTHRVLSTETPLAPATPYAACKAASFLALSQILPRAGTRFAWARLFHLHGAGEDPRRLAGHLHERLAAGLPVELSHGRQIRDYMDVSDAARAIARLVHARTEGPVNVCSGVPVSLRQLATGIAEGYGRRDLLRFGAREAPPGEPDCIVGIPTEVA